MKRFILSTVIALSFALIPPAFAQTPARGLSVSPALSAPGSWGTYHALIIGINDYKEWPKLRTAVKDATEIRNILVSRYNFDKKNVLLLTDRNASRRQIARDLRSLAKSLGEDDNLLIYYAGHGQLDDLTGDGYWVPAEGALKDPSTWVANSYIKSILSSEKVLAKNVVVIADSCYSGSMLRGGPSLMSLDDRRYREKLAEKAALRSRQVISSGGVEPVADGGAGGHSLFAFYLIDALQKNDREAIDLENLFHTKVWRPVTEIGNQRPNVGRLKTPMDQDGQFVLYNAAWVNEQARKKAAEQEALEAQRQAQARQKSAVAAAELELQRQRLEMEKQRLSLEKEQLAQQKALEIERLKLEKQKQAFEYAKLQEQLEKIKQKSDALKQREKQPFVASVSPDVLDPKSPNRRRAVQNSYRLAIFPINIYTFGDGRMEVSTIEINSIKEIANIASDDDRLTFNYCYREIEGITGGVKILKNVSKKSVWKKESFFSKLKPNWEEVRKEGQKIDANLIVMADGDVDSKEYSLYLYDCEHSRIYSSKIKAVRFNAPEQIARATRTLLKDFYKRK